MPFGTIGRKRSVSVQLLRNFILTEGRDVKLPSVGHPLRDAFNVGGLAERASLENRASLPTLKEARERARLEFALDKMTSSTPRQTISYLVLREHGNVQLVTFGSKKAMWVRWNFGR